MSNSIKSDRLIQCPVCGNKKAEIRKVFIGDFYITDIISCRKCGLIRSLPSSVNDNLAMREIEKIAKAAKAERERNISE